MPSFLTPINEGVELAQKHYDDYKLTVDSAVGVGFGGVTSAHVVVLFSDRKVRARLTSADGSAQAVPVDGFFSVICATVPYTAIDLTRVAGQETRVQVFVGEKSP